MAKNFSIYQCTNSDCQLRFPAISENEIHGWCPKCKSPLLLVYSYSEERTIFPAQGKINFPLHLSIFLDNIRSVYNVGSILRSADGFKIDHVYLCGITATPNEPKIHKTGLGAEIVGFWSYSANSLLKAKDLKKEGKYLIGLECCLGSKPIFELRPPLLKKEIVLVLGNELAGIDPQVRQICDEMICIPMQGNKSSFNVTIAFGIAAFYIYYVCQKGI